MPLQLGKLRQDLLQRLHMQHEGAHGACLALVGRKGGLQGADGDVVRRLSNDVDLLFAKASPNCIEGPSNGEMLKQVSDDVRLQLQKVLEVVKELTAEKGERPACAKHAPHEAVELLEQFLALDLPAQLLAELPLLQFEARKDVMNLCCALLWHGMPQQVDRQVVHYLQHHPRVFQIIMDGYGKPEAALHCGVVLRSYARHAELVEAFLKSGHIFDLVRFTNHRSVDISSDAFYSLREVLLGHTEVSAPWLEVNYRRFFGLYNAILQGRDYMAQRQALTLLASLLTDKNFRRVMVAFVNEAVNLKINMNLLRDSSKAVQFEAFQLFRLFAANPRKSPRVLKILYQNRSRLLKLVEGLTAMREDDKQFVNDRRMVVERLLALSPPN